MIRLIQKLGHGSGRRIEGNRGGSDLAEAVALGVPDERLGQRSGCLSVG